MNNLSKEFELLLGHAAFKLWPDLPRDMQEKLFETAVPDNPLLRYSFAVFLHEHHPRTAHPPKPLAYKTMIPMLLDFLTLFFIVAGCLLLWLNVRPRRPTVFLPKSKDYYPPS